MKNAPVGETTSHPAVIATKPPSAPFSVIVTLGVLSFIHVTTITQVAAEAAAKLVVTNIEDMVKIVLSPVAETVEHPLNPNQQNHKINTPRAPIGKLCP